MWKNEVAVAVTGTDHDWFWKSVFSKEDSPDAPEILDATCISTSLAEKEFAQLINSLTKDKGCGHKPS